MREKKGSENLGMFPEQDVGKWRGAKIIAFFTSSRENRWGAIAFGRTRED